MLNKNLKKTIIRIVIPAVSLLFLILFAGVILKDKLNLVFFNQSACANSGSGCGAGAGADGFVGGAENAVCSYVISWRPDNVFYNQESNITFTYTITATNCSFQRHYVKPYLGIKSQSEDPLDPLYLDKYSAWDSYLSTDLSLRNTVSGTLTRKLPLSYPKTISTPNGPVTIQIIFAGEYPVHLHWAVEQPNGTGFYPETIALGTSPIDIFINSIPKATNLSADASNFCSGSNAVVFSWAYNDADGGYQTAYKLWIDDDSNFGSPLKWESNTADTQISIPSSNFNKNTLYYWKVQVKDDDKDPTGAWLGWSLWASGPSFTTDSCNRPPVANAGPDQTVNERSSVTVAGTGSDPDGDPLTFKWSWNPALVIAGDADADNDVDTADKDYILAAFSRIQPQASNCPLSRCDINNDGKITIADIVSVTNIILGTRSLQFTAPEVTVSTPYTFSLIVNDGKVDSPSDSVVITVSNVNQPPTVAVLPPNTFSNTFNLCDVSSPSVILSWTFSDPDGDSQSAYQVKINNVDSPKIDLPSNEYAPPNLSFGITYNWQVKVWDSRGAESVWFPGASFTTPSHDYPAVAFEPHKAVTNEPVQFQDKSQVFGGTTISSRFWIFQDATPMSSTAQNPSVTFLSPGEREKAKSVILQVTDSSTPTGFSCEIKGVVDVGLPLPDVIEIPPY